MKKIIVFVLMLVFSAPVFAEGMEDSSEVKIILLGNVTFGFGAKDIPLSKVDAALNITGLLSNKYYIVPIVVRDSIADLIRNDNAKPTLDVIADSINAEEIAFVNVNRFQNMLRMEIVLVNPKFQEKKKIGEGYDLIHYQTHSKEPLYDPSLVNAAQRALAVAVGDSALFVNDSLQEFNIEPAPTLVVGGIEYVDDPQYHPKWDLFHYAVISSYDAVETIFEEAKEYNNYVCYDIPSRDSIYALNNLFIVENYRPPSFIEIEALANFRVNYYIAGKLERQKEHSDISLTLYRIEEKHLVPVKEAKDFLFDDDTDNYRAILKNLTKQLLRDRK